MPSYAIFHTIARVFATFDIPVPLWSRVVRSKSFEKGFPNA
jgi:hypothetical protein